MSTYAEPTNATTSMPPVEQALAKVEPATDPRAKGGEFYAPRFVNSGAAVRRPILRRLGMSTAIARLWDVSERETGITLDVAAVG